MKKERTEILQKVANGEITPEQADEQLLGLSIVGNRREQLIAFLKWGHLAGYHITKFRKEMVDDYLKSL